MERVAVFIVFPVFLFFLWSILGLLNPRWARVRHRLAALGWLAVSFLMMGVVGNMLPDQEERRPPRAAAPQIDREELYQRWVESLTPEQRAQERRAGGTAGSTSRSGPSMAREWLPQVRGGLGSSMQSILSQMPDDIQPTPSQVGKSRRFTYRFADGSQIILVFRPAAGGGLELYTVDVRD